MPDTRRDRRRLASEPGRHGDFADQRGTMNAKAPQIVIAENDVAAPVRRANRDMSSVNLLDRPRVETAIARGAHIPFRCRRLLDQDATIEQPLEIAPGMRRSLSVPKDCGIARLTQPQQQPGQRLGH
jgi:hypothetical protein